MASESELPAVHSGRAPVPLAPSPLVTGATDYLGSELSADTLAELDGIVVSADRRQRLMETAQSLTVISPDEWSGTGKSIADVLAEHTGMQTRRYGGVGSFQTVSVRGVEGSEVLVMLDGIPLNSAMGGAVDLGKISPMRLESIEVYKGFVPSRYGGNSLGGVIDLKTTAATKGRTADIYASLAAYGTQDHQLVVGHGYNERLQLLGLLSFTHSDNDFTYLDRNNTPYNDTDDRMRRIENGQYTAGNLLLHPSASLGERWALVSNASLSLSKAHLPAPEGRVNKTAYYTEKRIAVDARLVDQRTGEALRLIPAIGYTITDGLRFSSSLDQGFGASHATETAPNGYTELGAVEQTLSIPITLSIAPNDMLTVEPTVHLHAADINPTVNTTDGAHGDWHSREGSVAAAADVSFTCGAVHALAGASIKGVYSQTDGGLDGTSMKNVPPADTLLSVWSAKGGLSARMLQDRLLLYVNAGRFSNQPSLRERYGARGAHNPNPTLVPETGFSSEAGVKLRVTSLYAELGAFYVQSTNKIITIFDGRQSSSVNCDGALAYGSELWITWSPLDILRFESRATLQHTENLTREYNWYGNRLPNEPALALFETLTVGPLKGITLRYGADLRSYYYRDPGNLSRVPAAYDGGTGDFWEVYHHLKLEWKAPSHVTIAVAAQNVTNDFLTSLETAHTGEPGYSWTLIPVNQWCISLAYSF